MPGKIRRPDYNGKRWRLPPLTLTTGDRSSPLREKLRPGIREDCRICPGKISGDRENGASYNHYDPATSLPATARSRDQTVSSQIKALLILLISDTSSNAYPQTSLRQ
jgi:hypothetical protein